MTLDPSRRARRGGGPSQDLWPKWMWVAVPVLVVVVVAGLWWAIFSPSEGAAEGPLPTATTRLANPQPTQGSTPQATLENQPTATRQVLPLSTFTPTPAGVSTPDAATTGVAAQLAVGGKAVVSETGGSGLNMRAGAGTGQARVKTLTEGSVVEIVGGPTDADGFTWWQVRDASGASGWVVAEYLVAQ